MNGIQHLAKETARIAINLHAPLSFPWDIQSQRHADGYSVRVNQLTFEISDLILAMDVSEARLRIQDLVMAQLYPYGL